MTGRTWRQTSRVAQCFDLLSYFFIGHSNVAYRTSNRKMMKLVQLQDVQGRPCLCFACLFGLLFAAWFLAWLVDVGCVFFLLVWQLVWCSLILSFVGWGCFGPGTVDTKRQT